MQTAAPTSCHLRSNLSAKLMASSGPNGLAQATMKAYCRLPLRLMPTCLAISVGTQAAKP